MDDLHSRQPLNLTASGTLCAGCQSRGVWTDHSPAGEQHQAWESRWEQDPAWVPDGAEKLTPILPVPLDVAAGTSMPPPRRWTHQIG